VLQPTRIAGLILGSIALLFVAFLLVGVLLPSGWVAERSTRIEAPAEVILPYLVSARRWTEWTPSPESGIEFTGPESGAGSASRWDDPGYGAGEFRIREVLRNEEVAYDVTVEDGAITIVGRLALTADGGGTLVTWREEGDFGWNPLLGYLAGRMDALQGAQLEASLAKLKGLVEAAPTTLAIPAESEEAQPSLIP